MLSVYDGFRESYAIAPHQGVFKAMPNPAEFPWFRVRGQGQLWHRTSISSLEAILRSGAIAPNTGCFKENSVQSDTCYSRHMQAVSLFDFDTSSEANVAEQAWGHLQIRGQHCSVLIGIRREALEPAKYQSPREASGGVYRLRESNVDRGEALTLIPDIEAIYCGPIPTAAFTGLFLTDGGGRFYEVPFGPYAVAVLLKKGAEWRDDDERLKSERHVHGQ